MASAHKITSALSGMKGCFVAGGAVTSIHTNKPINDFDIYPKSDQDLREAIAWLYDGSGYWCVDHSSRAMTFANGHKGENPNIQIMHFDTFETAEKIFEAFDFTVCMGAYDLDEKKFILHENFLEHCSQRFLSFNRATRFPYASARRVKKYEDRGFTIGTIEFQKIILACSAKPITSWEELKDQIGGVYGEAITIPEGEPFSDEAMWKALDTLTFRGPSGGFDSAEMAIMAVSQAPMKVFRQGKDLFADLYGDGEFTEVKTEPKNPIWVELADVVGTTFYKKVMVKNGRYYGPHRTTFEYKVGEDVISPSGPGIFVYQSYDAAKRHSAYNYGAQGEAVLELRIDDTSDVVLGSQITLKKAHVVSVHDLSDKEAA